ncbi:hypothetical protein [Sutcliffiella horikoshii]|uniref:hypothetical protein n=1 Tax=Sutcliffiella horikoshii TaxID=79883 RepID=UPI00384BD396
MMENKVAGEQGECWWSLIKIKSCSIGDSRPLKSQRSHPATIFKETWKLAREDKYYLKGKKEHQEKYG